MQKLLKRNVLIEKLLIRGRQKKNNIVDRIRIQKNAWCAFNLQQKALPETMKCEEISILIFWSWLLWTIVIRYNLIHYFFFFIVVAVSFVPFEHFFFFFFFSFINLIYWSKLFKRFSSDLLHLFLKNQRKA